MAKILDGKQVAAQKREVLLNALREWKQQGQEPGLAIIQASEDEGSRVYVSSMEKLAVRMGIPVTVKYLGGDISEKQLLSELDCVNQDDRIRGILLMMPLAPGLNAGRVAEHLNPAKDLDGLHPLNIGYVASGNPEGFAPCTPRAVMELLQAYDLALEGKRVLVIGRSNVVGKPLLQLLLAENATVTVAHSRTRDLAALAREQDVLIAAVGKAGMITADMVKPGAVVIDVGINLVDGQVVGDVDYPAVEKVAGAITPVPGGVGSVTKMMLLEALLRWRD